MQCTVHVYKLHGDGKVVSVFLVTSLSLRKKKEESLMCMSGIFFSFVACIHTVRLHVAFSNLVFCVLVFFRYSSVFPSLNMAVKRREQTLQDYKRLQAKVEKYEEKEKTGPVMVKLHQVASVLKLASVHVSVHSSSPSNCTGAEFTCSYMLSVLWIEHNRWKKTQMLTGYEQK